jgi:hypothetical protein
MLSDDSFSESDESATDSYPQLVESSPYRDTFFLLIHFNIIL